MTVGQAYFGGLIARSSAAHQFVIRDITQVVGYVL